MSREHEFRGRSKKTHKMTRDGLVEQNLTTGEEQRVSQRGQDFNLRDEAPPGYVHSAAVREAPQSRSQRAASISRFLKPPLSSPDHPMEAAQPVEHDMGARSRESSAGGTSIAGAPKPPGAGKPPASRLHFSKDEKQPDMPDKKLQRAQAVAERADEKLETARGKLPAKKELNRVRVYDDQKNKVTHKLQFEKVPLSPGEKRFKPPAVVAAPAVVAKGTVKTAGRGVHSQFHRKMYEAEHENVGVEAAHKAELAGETALRGGARATRSAYHFVKNTPFRTVERLEKQALKANVKLSFRKAVAESPQLQSNILSRFMQKRKIKRAYAKAAREAKRAGKAAKKTSSIIGNAAKAVVGFVKRHPLIAGIVALILFVLFFFSSILSSCSNMAAGTVSGVLGAAYTAKDRDIDDAELNYTEWEADLQIQVSRAEIDHPGYDEYRYEMDDIGHDPFELMAFLTAVYQDFTYAEIQGTLQSIFNEQYTLEFIPEVEIRYRSETHNDPVTGESYDVEVPYEWHILNVNLTARSFSDVIAPRMDAQQRARFEVYMETKGRRQYLISPFDFNWLPLVTGYYGWRVHPATGAKDFHAGINIAVPVGTEIIAGHSGRVTSAGYSGDYGYVVVIEDDKGLQSKYAHCNEILVSVGQQIEKGDVIAKSGNSGAAAEPQLHLEILKNGQYLNPLFFGETNDDGSGKIPPGSPGGIAYPEYPGAPMGDGMFAAMMEEAEKHLGKQYVFGAKGPDKFDCSGFVSWVLTHSGVKTIRTNAQGIYNASTPVSPENAQPGDLIFFKDTYSTPNTVTHVGIYIGNGMMVHAGKPVQYTSIDTRYWNEHFYSYGRIN